MADEARTQAPVRAGFPQPSTPGASARAAGESRDGGTLSVGLLLGPAPLFVDRADAGRALARELESKRGAATVVVGLARGGVQVAAEVARILEAPLDVVAVRKIGHPRQPEYGLGAATPGNGVYIRGHDGLTDDEVAAAVDEARTRAVLLDRRLHHDHQPVELVGRTAIVVDDGLATGGTMIAALRWARAAGAAHVVAAVPVGASDSLELLAADADDVVCLYAPAQFLAVGVWYREFEQVDDVEVIRLLHRSRREIPVESRSDVRVPARDRTPAHGEA